MPQRQSPGYRAVSSWTTDETGLRLELLEAGTYTVREITPPVGYAAADITFMVVCMEDGKITVTGSVSQRGLQAMESKAMSSQ